MHQYKLQLCFPIAQEEEKKSLMNFVYYVL